MRTLPVLLSLSALGPASAADASPVRRFALVVGANRGAADRVPLRYAVADAERFAEVVTTMGGVQGADQIVLRDPSRQELVDALALTGGRAARARTESERVEVVFYFSGHADDRGLMLGRELLPYLELRSAVRSVNADVGITILDACASGAITRLKSGQPHPAFLTGSSGEVQGYAFLTSSSEDEAAQESERLGASFFTHALLTGLRGAADVSGDNRVTLNEAYEFAFHETVVQTTTTQAGAQHPAYDIKMAGTGDVVMTDLRETSSRLVLGPDYDGRFVVFNAKRQMVAELFKPHGRTIELGLEPGGYELYYEQKKQLMSSSLTLADGQRHELARAELKQAERVPARRRGESEEASPDLLDGRFRFEFGWLSRTSLIRWINPELGLHVSLDPNSTQGDWSVLFGARYYPWLSGRFRPYTGLALGAFDVAYSSGPPNYRYWTSLEAGAAFELGADFYIGRHFSVGVKSQASFTSSRNHLDTWVNLGWTFGGPRKPSP
jgi:hypothetical protein